MKTSTGIGKLDVFMDGGFGENEIILVKGEKSAKNLFTVQFLKKGVYITTEIVENVKERIEKHKLESKIAFITIGSEGGDKHVEGPSSLEEISIALDDIWKGAHAGNIVINSLSSLMLHNSLERIVDFLNSIINKCKQKKKIVMLAIDEGTIKGKDLKTIEEMSTVIVGFVRNDAGNFIRVRDSCPNSLLEFKINKNGIELKEEFL